ncbi:hypothetical protein D3C76_1661640 [compost metagenome]
MEELIFFHRRFKDDDLNTLRLDTLHNPLDRGRAEVIRPALHNQTIHAHHLRLTRQNGVRDKVFARTVRFNNR